MTHKLPLHLLRGRISARLNCKCSYRVMFISHPPSTANPSFGAGELEAFPSKKMPLCVVWFFFGEGGKFPINVAPTIQQQLPEMNPSCNVLCVVCS